MKGQRSHLNDPRHEREHELDVTDIRNEDTKHEEGDINVTPVYKFLFWLGALMVFTYFLIFGIMKMNDSRIEKENEMVTHVAKSKSEQLPPEPRLQLAPGHAEHPLDEGINYRDSVSRVLESYGYINKTAGIVHIPIDLAKQVLIQQGLPVRAQQPGTPIVPAIMIPEFSSAGRTYIARDPRVPGGTFTVTGGNINIEKDSVLEEATMEGTRP
ncbi:MAG TPA: hypothetical protein VG537_05005 [Candidatus Kapabacteria bacterium]|jgi:hypothetical protein|nr:hypothetical protein [Candidatus Kapabacteria bacterium]